MGYTHYWRRPRILDKEKFAAFVADVKNIFRASAELGIELADGLSEADIPEASDVRVWFNGSDNQPIGVWTTMEEIMIPWPSPSAGLEEQIRDPIASKVSGKWFAGDLLNQRTAPIHLETGLGAGSYETFMIERDYEIRDWEKPDENNHYFCFCKTAYRPYDLIVTAVLIAFKHHFPEVELSSDGVEKDWLDAKVLCNNYLGYGIDFCIEESVVELV